jgi:hypothetical protein
MQLVGLESAVSEIHQACGPSADDPRRSPFFFIVGAGVSFPPVPLASSIIDHCRKLATDYNRRGEEKEGHALDAYSHWFALAYPQARQRQQYLRELMQNKAISLANLRLAHLIGARKLTNLVVTTNFDDMLSRALRLFGHLPAICDTRTRSGGSISTETRSRSCTYTAATSSTTAPTSGGR